MHLCQCNGTTITYQPQVVIIVKFPTGVTNMVEALVQSTVAVRCPMDCDACGGKWQAGVEAVSTRTRIRRLADCTFVQLASAAGDGRGRLHANITFPVVGLHAGLFCGDDDGIFDATAVILLKGRDARAGWPCHCITSVASCCMFVPCVPQGITLLFFAILLAAVGII